MKFKTETITDVPIEEVGRVMQEAYEGAPTPTKVTSSPDRKGTFTVTVFFPADATDSDSGPGTVEPPKAVEPPAVVNPPEKGDPGHGGSPAMTDSGFKLLRDWEGCILGAYDDANDHRVNPGDAVHGTLTIGYGHTGSDVVPGLTWTKEQAEEALRHDIDAVVRQIKPLITCSLSDNQFSAFVCFAFNIGIEGFAGSSALHLANAGDLAKVPAALSLWNKAQVNGVAVPSAGLTNRRNAEIELWNTGGTAKANDPQSSKQEPCWIYAQRTGNMFHRKNGSLVLRSSGYSGNGEYENNPDKQFVKRHGPIPRGWYTIGQPEKFKTMVNCLPLTPDPGNDMGGRSGFLIHDGAFNNPHGHGMTSEGCICLPQIRRIEIWESGDRRLQVVADLPAS